jgi:lipoate-protein ligase B
VTLRWALWPRLSYDDGVALQERLVAARRRGGPDCVVATEHDAVVTLGRRAGAEECVLAPDEIERRGVAVRRTERGGLATYHGPGQLVLYPIVDVRPLGVRRFVALLEAAALAIVDAAGLVGETRPGQPGVWVGVAKVAAVGVRVVRGISSHGLAVNLGTDVTPFAWIRPCGVAGGVAGALDQLGGRRLALADAARVGVARLAAGLGATAEAVPPAVLDPPADSLGAAVGR